MQVFQRLFKTANETTTSSPSISKKETANNQKVKSKDIVLFGICRGSTRRRGDKSKSSSKTFNIFKALCRNKDISQEYFYSTIHLKRVESNRRRQHFEYCMNMKNKSLTRGLSISHKAADSVGHTQVLPITDSAPPSSSSSSSSSSTNDKARRSNGEKKDEKVKGDKAKTISKMKELLRWAAAAKSEKGRQYIGRKVFNNFRNRGALKAVPDDDQMSNESPKISFRWEVESCSTTSSAYSAISMPASLTKNDQSININFPSVKSTPLHIDQCSAAAGKLNWITTDSEFVVLEL